MPSAGANVVLRESQWLRLSNALGEQMGLYYPKERWGDLGRGIAAAAQTFGKSADACVDWLLSSPLSRQQIEVLASCLTVGETYFFREKRSFDVLRDEILPSLLRARQDSERRLRIWSAGCCTGEEPYSIAMLLASTIPNIQDWNISIVATDIDPTFLRKASTGVYSNWSFRDSPPEIKGRYFRGTLEGRFEIAPRIKDLVTFSYLNLAEDSYPSVANGTNAMDIVFCRNVLMYFELPHAMKVLQRLGWSLMEGGWLFINPVEIPQATLPQLERVQFGDVILHRKASAASTRTFPTVVLRGVPDLPEAVSTEGVLTKATPAAPEATFEYAQPIELAPAANEAAHIAPTHSLHEVAATAYREGRYAQAVQAALDILAAAPDDVTAPVLLARAYANQGRLAQALQCCEKAVARDKLNAGWRGLMATILQELGQLDEAADTLRGALYLDPNQPLAHFALGTVLRRQGRAEDAQRHVRNALAILDGYEAEQIVPESEGLSARRLANIIRVTMTSGNEP